MSTRQGGLRAARVADLRRGRLRLLTAPYRCPRRVCPRRGIALSHIKPHGALYIMAARDDAVADGIARAARDFSPTLSVFALPNAALASASRHYGMRVVAEFFADRPYVDGQVVMFGWTAEQIGSPDDAALRVKTMLGSE